MALLRRLGSGSPLGLYFSDRRRSASGTIGRDNRSTQFLLGQLGLLLTALSFSKWIYYHYPVLWLFVPILIAAIMATARYSEDERPVVRFWQLVGFLSALYSLVNYPLIPLVNHAPADRGLYILILVMWLVSTAAGIAGFKIPSLSVLPPAFLLWSKAAATVVTGLPAYDVLDVLPLPEISICIAGGLLINQAAARYFGETQSTSRLARGEFACLVLLMAIAIHMANYFWSFYAKASLPRSPHSLPGESWVLENNPAYIYLSALDNDHIFFSIYPTLVASLYRLVNSAHIVSNVWVFLAQAAAITAFFLRKRALLILLLLFDLMHLSILLIVGANFWPWILLNGIIAYIVARPDYGRPSLLLRLLATGFIVVSPEFVSVARLGWYDSGANNKLFFEAVDDEGGRHYVPTNFFTFSSYSIAHLDFVKSSGIPGPDTAFATHMNGATTEYEMFKAGRRCDPHVLYRPGYYHDYNLDKLAAFVRSYHQLALKMASIIGSWPYNYYPHHFYVPAALDTDFDNLDKRRIVAYVFRRESSCLGFDGSLRRDVKSTAEYRIDITAAGK